MSLRPRSGWAIVAAVICVSCGLNPVLYPDNDVAASSGILRLRVNPNGAASLVLPTGEAMTGRFSELSGPVTGFGALLGKSSIVGVGAAAPGSRFGVITLAGDMGTRMNCEWVAGSAGQGAGICETQTGARYRILW